MKTTTRSGFTLVESALGLGFMTMIFGAAFAVQKSTVDLLSTTSTSGVMEEKARKSLATIATELPWAEGSSLLITNENGSNRLDLRVSTSYVSEAVVWSNTITYSVAPSTFDANHDGIQNEGDLVRTQNGITRTLCSAVVNGGFTATRVDDHVTLQLRLAQTDTHTASELASNASTVITLRN